MIVAARFGTDGRHRVAPLCFPRRRTIKGRYARKTLRLLVFVALVTGFAAGHAGDLFKDLENSPISGSDLNPSWVIAAQGVVRFDHPASIHSASVVPRWPATLVE
jgi:hypothetical protein